MSKSRRIANWPASINGVNPFLSRCSIFAPRCKRRTTSSSWPPAHDRVNAVSWLDSVSQSTSIRLGKRRWGRAGFDAMVEQSVQPLGCCWIGLTEDGGGREEVTCVSGWERAGTASAWVTLASICSPLGFFSIDSFDVTAEGRFAGVKGGNVLSCSLNDWLAIFLISWIKLGLFDSVLIRSRVDGLLASSRRCSKAFCLSVLIHMGIFIGLVGVSLGEIVWRFFNWRFISSRWAWFSWRCFSSRRSHLMRWRWKGFFDFECCWWWWNDGRLVLLLRRRLVLDEAVGSWFDVEKKSMVGDGIGRTRLVVEKENGSSCLIAGVDEEEFVDDELDVDDEEVVRFFLPVLIDEEDAAGGSVGAGRAGFELM